MWCVGSTCVYLRVVHLRFTRYRTNQLQLGSSTFKTCLTNNVTINIEIGSVFDLVTANSLHIGATGTCTGIYKQTTYVMVPVTFDIFQW